MSDLGVDIAGTDGNQDKDGSSTVDWMKARAHGVAFGIVRGSYERWADATFARNIEKAHEAGVRVSKYAFGVPGPDHPPPEDQMDVMIEAGGALRSGYDLPPTIDIELPHGVEGTGMTLDKLVDWYGRAITHLRKRLGIDPMEYSSPRVLDTTDVDAFRGALNEVLAGLWTWFARYQRGARVEADMDLERVAEIVARQLGEADIRQYQGDALRVPGIPGIADLDCFFPLTLGSHGPRVRRVQRRVNTKMDDAFGPMTLVALRNYQTRNSLSVSGVMDLATFCKLAWEPISQLPSEVRS